MCAWNSLCSGACSLKYCTKRNYILPCYHQMVLPQENTKFHQSSIRYFGLPHLPLSETVIWCQNCTRLWVKEDSDITLFCNAMFGPFLKLIWPSSDLIIFWIGILNKTYQHLRLLKAVIRSHWTSQNVTTLAVKICLVGRLVGSNALWQLASIKSLLVTASYWSFIKSKSQLDLLQYEKVRISVLCSR